MRNDPDHDIMRDPPDDEACSLCGGTGEVTIEDPDGDRHDETCPRCMHQEHQADEQRLRARLQLADEVIRALAPHLGRLPLRAEVFDALNRYDAGAHAMTAPTTEGHEARLPYHETNPGHPDATRWYHLIDLLPILRRIKPSAWATRDAGLKYIGLRYDTRTGHALITDAHGKPIHVERLIALGTTTPTPKA